MKTNKIIGTIIISLLLCSTVFGLPSETKQENDLAKLNLQGKVKTCTERVNVVIKGAEDIFKSNLRYSFNEDGYITEMVSFNFEKKIINKKVLNYNSAKKITECVLFNGTDLFSKEIIHYDEKNNLIEDINFGNGDIVESRITNLYDLNGNKIETIEYGPKNKVVSKSTSIYNDLNQEIKTIYFDSLNQQTYYLKYLYNNMGEVSDMSTYLNNGNLYMKTTFEYVKKQQVKNKNVFDGNGTRITLDEFSYNNSGKITHEAQWQGTTCTKYIDYMYNAKNLAFFINDKVKLESRDISYNSNNYITKEVIYSQFTGYTTLSTIYDFDVAKNWTSKIESNSLEPASTKSTREITYY